ncbi:MAG: DUF3667 domain-containing protein [Cyclobacteriaceae bacterium]|nr:DUF3667 domain-containing protein [Cyclobacteriaceae bacterium]
MEDLGKSLPVVEHIIDTEQAGIAADQKVCLNCGANLQGSFCHQCGQKNLPRRQDITDLLINFISSFYSFESKFFKTFGFLLFRPARIINDYNSGKRESYYHPARMYVFLSFIFFFVLSLIPDEDKINMTSDGKELSKEEKAIVLDSLNLNFDTVSWGKYEPKTLTEYDSIENLKPAQARDGKLERYFTEKFIRLKEESGSDERTILKRFFDAFLENIPRMIFLLLPVFALILKLLYIRRDFYFSEHLIFSVFFYDFMYLIGTIGLLCSLVSWLNWIPNVLTLLVYFYLYKALRKVYKQSRSKTILKFILLNALFLTSLVIGFMINAVVTLILM